MNMIKKYGGHRVKSNSNDRAEEPIIMKRIVSVIYSDLFTDI